jgi:hypothetical protein
VIKVPDHRSVSCISEDRFPKKAAVRQAVCEQPAMRCRGSRSAPKTTTFNSLTAPSSCSKCSKVRPTSACFALNGGLFFYLRGLES